MKITERKHEIFEISKLMQNSISKFLNPIAKQENLSKIQLMILLLMDRSESEKITSIAEKLELNQGNTSSICKKLEEEGYILKQKDLEDERIVHLKLTVKGKKVVQKVFDRLDDIGEKLEKVSSENLDTIILQLKEFSEILNYIVSEEEAVC